MITADARRLTVRMDKERASLARRGARAMRATARGFREVVVRVYVEGGELPRLLVGPTEAAARVLVSAMVAGAFLGRLRSAAIASEFLRRRVSLASYLAARAPGFDEAIEAMRNRCQLLPEDVDRLANTFGNEAARVMRRASAAVERKAQAAIAEIVESGVHVRKGRRILARRLSAAGMGGVSPHLIETLVRTQIQIAYSAGRQWANQDPAIDEILWGYEYFTAGDNRVRPNHSLLDGMRLPKDDPRWAEMMPPNGFMCRCSVVEIFSGEGGRQVVKLPGSGGGADKGWAWNPGKTFPSALPPVGPSPLALPPKVARKKPVAPRKRAAPVKRKRVKKPVAVAPPELLTPQQRVENALHTKVNIKLAPKNGVKALEQIADEAERMLAEHGKLSQYTRGHLKRLDLDDAKYVIEGTGKRGVSSGVCGKRRMAVSSNYVGAREQLTFGRAQVTNNCTTGIFRHELGHSVLQQLPLPKVKRWWKIAIDDTPFWRVKGISKYALANPAEAFCEAFSAFTSKAYVPGKLPPKMEAFLKRLLGKPKAPMPYVYLPRARRMEIIARKKRAIAARQKRVRAEPKTAPSAKPKRKPPAKPKTAPSAKPKRKPPAKPEAPPPAAEPAPTLVTEVEPGAERAASAMQEEYTGLQKNPGLRAITTRSRPPQHLGPSLERVEIKHVLRVPYRWGGHPNGVKGYYKPFVSGPGATLTQGKITIAGGGITTPTTARLGGYTVGSGVRATFRHEFGHHVHDLLTYATDKKAIKLCRDWGRLYHKLGEGWFKANVSTYAGTNWMEGFAECFSFYTSPLKRGKLPAEIASFFGRLLAGGV